MFLRILVMLLIFLCSADALAETKRLAVLEFRGVGVDSMILHKLSDQARRAAVETLSQDEYLIMTRENMMQILSDMGKDASCIEGNCEVDIGRNIGVDLIVTGDVIVIEKAYVLTLKLYDTHSGALLNIKEVQQETLLTLKDGVYTQSLLLIADGVQAEKTQTATTSPPTQESSSVTVEEKGDGASSSIMANASSGGRTVNLEQQPVIMGALADTLIRPVLARNEEALLSCYDEGLRTDPDIKGELRIKFVVAADGSVSKTKVKSSELGSKTTEACILEQFQKMTFPKPKGGGVAVVIYPLIFS